MAKPGIYPLSKIVKRFGNKVRCKLPNREYILCEAGNQCRQNICVVFIDKKGRGVAYGEVNNKSGTKRQSEFYRSNRKTKKVEGRKVKVLFEDGDVAGKYWVGGDRKNPTLIEEGWDSNNTSDFDYKFSSTGQKKHKWIVGVVRILNSPYTTELEIRGEINHDESRVDDDENINYYLNYRDIGWWELRRTTTFPGDDGGGSSSWSDGDPTTYEQFVASYIDNDEIDYDLQLDETISTVTFATPTQLSLEAGRAHLTRMDYKYSVVDSGGNYYIEGEEFYNTLPGESTLWDKIAGNPGATWKGDRIWIVDTNNSFLGSKGSVTVEQYQITFETSDVSIAHEFDFSVEVQSIPEGSAVKAISYCP